MVLPSYYKGWRLAGQLAACYLPTVWAIASLRMAREIAAGFMAPIEDNALWVIVCLGFFICLYGPGMIYANYHRDLWHEVMLLVRDRKSGPEAPNNPPSEDEEE